MRTSRTIRASSWSARRRCHSRSPRFDPRAITTVSAVVDADLVGELVDIAAPPWEESLELFSRAVNRIDDAVCELACFESSREPRCDVIPETGRNLLVDPFVTKDHEPLFFARHEEQDTVAQ